MNDFDFIPSIRVDFYLTSSDDFDFDEVSQRLGIIPTDTRKKNEFPPQSILAGVACTGWRIKTEAEDCLTVATKFKEMLKILDGKAEVIKAICDDYNIEASFVVVIHMVGEDNPEMVLPKEVVSFAGFINAEISFDLYCY